MGPSKMKTANIVYRKLKADAVPSQNLESHVSQLSAAMMSWVGRLKKDSEHFILFAVNSQILLKISVIPILLTFMYLVALYLLNLDSKQPTHCPTQLINVADNWPNNF